MESMVINQLKEFYSGKRVFITGHTGFKGAWLAATLYKLGAIVKGYALPPLYETPIFDELAGTNKIQSEFGDIRDIGQLKLAVSTFMPDLVFHLAAQPLVRQSYKAPAETFHINVTGTANLLESLLDYKGKVAIVIVTTDKVYENKEKDIAYTELDLLGGYDPYSSSKACTEMVASSFRQAFFNAKDYELHLKAIATARAGNVIGGGDWSEDRLVPDIIRSLQVNKKIELRNPGAVRPWQFVLEPVVGYLLLGAKLYGDAGRYGTAYNFGPNLDDHLTVEQLVKIAISLWGGGDWAVMTQQNAPHEAGLLKLAIEKAKQELGWQPKLNAALALEWTVNWYKMPDADKVAFTFQQIQQFLDL